MNKMQKETFTLISMCVEHVKQVYRHHTRTGFEPTTVVILEHNIILVPKIVSILRTTTIRLLINA